MSKENQKSNLFVSARISHLLLILLLDSHSKISDQPQAMDRGDYTAGRVAFTAKLCTDHSRPQKPGPMKFSMVKLNEGNGFNGESGVFTCPLDGVYYFVVNASVYGRGHCAIYKNGEKIASLYHANSGDDRCTQVASMSSVLKLSEKDEVWIQVFGSRYDILATEDNDTVFTGFLLG